MEKFYMVMRDNCDNFTRKRHEAFVDAEREAMRLCAKENERFIILTATDIIQPIQPKIEHITIN